MSDEDWPRGGVPIVLTSSRAEMSVYGGDPFLAFSCTFPHKLTRYLEKYLGPDDFEDGSARYVPYGLRKVEALLVREFGRSKVVVSHYHNLSRFVGPNTKLVCISTMDPLGLAYVSTTYNSLIGFGGESLNAVEFKKLLNHPSIKRHSPFVMVGGAGVWQIEEAGVQDRLGIDMLFQGEAEPEIVDVVRRIMEGEAMPRYYVATENDFSSIPTILAPATYGSVEISRGCGRGCKFCTPTMRKRYSVPLHTILKEIDITVKSGCPSIFVLSEDIFLYKIHDNFIPNRDAVIDLFSNIAKRPGVQVIHLSHASLAPVVYDPLMLEEITPYLLEKSKRRLKGERFVTVEVGVETGSRRLMKMHMAGKALPYHVDDWPELVIQGIGIMNDNNWYPLITMITGLPGETEEDVIATLELIDELKDMKLFFTPLLFIPLKEALLSDAKRVSLENLSELQFEFITRSWKYNIGIWGDQVRSPIKMKHLLPFVFLGVHFLYSRWRHGPRLTRPILKLAGFPDHFIGGYVGRWCEPDYCIPDRKFPRYAIHRDRTPRLAGGLDKV